ncbi:glycosyltransferase family 2 protein [Aestuariibacter sp. GS-14]|uniref:glycosyltransferase family 2 protein n=1 Tax=Aestuariibacter sp. GS-14 TaxID=2590670 RepID=UPI00112B68BE|nr:glycosyltransferase family A protein [Aestuariibacter sp. GS-14]TPV55462.1 glycosyltransferase family 2 protein [Aestuariibacter sp. GS-14]
MMGDALYVTVVVPTHGRKALLQQLLESLYKQTYSHDKFEIVVVHNYSNDGTEEAVREWRKISPVPLHYVKKHNNTPTPSRHYGGTHAKGDIIAFIDDDCIAEPDWIANGARQFASALSERPVGLVQGKTLPNPSHPRRFLEKTVNISSASIFFETCNIFYSKAAFDAVGGFSTEFMDKFYGEDTDLGWKVKKAGFEVVFEESATVYHHVFHVSFWKWLKEPLFFKHLPYLMDKHPELRSFMWHRYFLTVETAFFQLLLLGIVLTLFSHIGFSVLCLPYVIQRYRSGSAMPNPILRVIRIGAGLPRSLFTWYALTSGSIRYRSILL